MKTRKPRYALPTAARARTVLAQELTRHGYPLLATQYRAGILREKGVMSRLGCISLTLEARGDAYNAKVARGIALLAAYLHEGKHQRTASADALRTFWAHYDRVHGRR
jgi:hypothetical protein